MPASLPRGRGRKTVLAEPGDKTHSLRSCVDAAARLTETKDMSCVRLDLALGDKAHSLTLLRWRSYK